MRFLKLLLLAGLIGVPTAWAEDTPRQASLLAFFAQGIQVQGATAELIDVQAWPDTTGPLNWYLPNLRNHPVKISLIATKGSGSHARRWYVSVRVHWWADAIVVTNDTPARSILSIPMLSRKRVDIAGHSGRWWSDARQLAGNRTTRPLRKDQIVFSSFVKRPPLIKRGDEVVIIVQFGGVRVSAMGKALKPARIGDRLRVQNTRSKEVMQATVIDAHTVHVIARGT